MDNHNKNKAAETAALIQEQDNRNWIHPWEDMTSIGHANRTVIDHAQGIYVYDQDGRALIDGPAGMWCVQIGYGRKDMAKVISDQVLRMTYMSPFSLTSQPSAQLAKKLAELAPGDLNHVFLTTGGSTAVDNALRFVDFYHNLKGQPYKKHILACSHSYHGATQYCAQVSAKDKNESWFDNNSPLVHFLPQIDVMQCPKDLSMETYCDLKVAEFEAKILSIGADCVGVFIAEPIQASGGIMMAPDGYLRRCRELCHKYDILYISDEVVTGFGRLGHWFASEPVFGIQPDIITCAKGLSSGYLPIGAFIVSDRLIDEVAGQKSLGALFSQGFTYSGHPVCCAAALKNIEILHDERILEHVRLMEPEFQKKLQDLRDEPLVVDAHGKGFLAAVVCELPKNVRREMDNDELACLVADHSKQLGLLVRPIHNRLVLSPPLILTSAEMALMFDRLRQALVNTMDALS